MPRPCVSTRRNAQHLAGPATRRSLTHWHAILGASDACPGADDGRKRAVTDTGPRDKTSPEPGRPGRKRMAASPSPRGMS